MACSIELRKQKNIFSSFYQFLKWRLDSLSDLTLITMLQSLQLIWRLSTHWWPVKWCPIFKWVTMTSLKDSVRSISFGWCSEVDLEIIHHMAKSHFLWLPWNKVHIIYVWILFLGSPGLYLERGMGASPQISHLPPQILERVGADPPTFDKMS